MSKVLCLLPSLAARVGAELGKANSSPDGDGFAHPTEGQSLYASPYEEEDLPFIDPQEQAPACLNGSLSDRDMQTCRS
jgi:hypothetical protein